MLVQLLQLLLLSMSSELGGILFLFLSNLIICAARRLETLTTWFNEPDNYVSYEHSRILHWPEEQSIIWRTMGAEKLEGAVLLIRGLPWCAAT